MSKILGIVKKQVEPDSSDRLSRQEESETKLDSPVAKKKGSGNSKSSKKKVGTIEEDPHLPTDQLTTIKRETTSGEFLSPIGASNSHKSSDDVPPPVDRLNPYSYSVLSPCFQAIGKISIEIALNPALDLALNALEASNNLVNIIFEEREFSLYFADSKREQKSIFNLKHTIAEYKLSPDDRKDHKLEIIVYPIIGGSTTSFHYRNLVTEKNKSTYNFLSPNHFKLSGLWQSIDGQTCIQIRSVKLIDRVTKLIKPLNVPVNWDNCPIQISSAHSVRVSIEAIFNPDSGIFNYVRTLEEPTQYHSSPCRRLRLKPTPPPILKAKTGGMLEGLGKGENFADSIVGGEG
jgi:hypothetical protein